MARLEADERRLRQKLAANVRRLREGMKPKKLSVIEAANRAKVHWRWWQKVEAGEKNVTVRSLSRIAPVLGVEPYELLK